MFSSSTRPFLKCRTSSGSLKSLSSTFWVDIVGQLPFFFEVVCSISRAGGRLILERSADLFAQLRAGGVPVYRHGVLGCRPKHFFLLTGDGQRAVRLAREVPAVSYLAHRVLLWNPTGRHVAGCGRNPACRVSVSQYAKSAIHFTARRLARLDS